ncbi:MAG: DUF2779 domain-containing protein [Deltaproteobacteria bacterium]|jgi:hypothetical protein|nr:DUF2779 domain-containing protein [Deltaproteobacteria bacterium]
MRSHAKLGLSKSLLLKGIQCPKALYLAKFPPPLEIPTKPELEARFRAGHEVGTLAQELFPGGTEVPFKGLSFGEQIKRTQRLIGSGVNAIYEASFGFDGIFVKVDILARDGVAWQIHEVKMGTSVKDVNLDDVAIQYYVLTNCGLKISKVFLVHINTAYERHGPIDVRQLFASDEVTDDARLRQNLLPQQVSQLRRTLRGGEPNIDIGPYCLNPYECDYIPYCWQHIPENSIFDLRGNGVNKFELYKRGIVRLQDVPADELNANQHEQLVATLNKRDSVNHQAVDEFLQTLWYPICFLDFETFSYPIPLFDNCRPYQQIPFQYSMHVRYSENSKLEHYNYLAPPSIDPRRELTETLLNVVPEGACVLTYNQAFEKNVLKTLADLYPDLSVTINNLLLNVRDLMVPFRRRDIYCWQMRGSYSIKEVLPAMVPDMSYDGLQVADGAAAMQAYLDMRLLKPGVELSCLRQAMLDYCRLDTLAMVKILDKIKGFARNT